MPKQYSYLLLLLVVLYSCNLSRNKNSIDKNEKDLFQSGIVSPRDYKAFPGDTITVMSWNVEHFIDSHDNPYTNNRREDSGGKMENRVSMFVEALRAADADIVVLQEFEHVQFLQQIVKDSLPKMGYNYFADHESIGWYMNVVVMSRIPLGILYGYGAVHTPVSYTDEKTGIKKFETQSRINTRMWSVDVLVNEDYNFLLTGVHLKAGRGPRNVAMRLGQIEFLKGQFQRFLNENPDRNMLIVGDFNATPESEEIQSLVGDTASVKFVDNLPQEVFSHPADAPRWRIDHILPHTNMQKELIDNSLEVKYFFEAQKQRQLADHLPLLAKFVTIDK